MRVRTLILSVLLILLYSYASATIINIPADYPAIQQGINASSDGDTVLVQPGTYVENVNFNGHNIVLGSLFLTTGDTSFIEQTIVDGDSMWTVVKFENGEARSTKIIGLTIKNGVATKGGGIYCSYSSPTISNNILQNNTAYSEAGGGIYLEYSHAIINANNIIDNSSHWGGGGIYCIFSNAVVSYNMIISNETTHRGGGISIYGAEPVIYNNIMVNNLSEDMGGGVYMEYAAPLFINNIVTSNSAFDLGGGISSWSSYPDIRNCVFWDNSAVYYDEIFVSQGSAEIRYCDVQGGFEGEGNIDSSPNFRAPRIGDFHLMSIACGDSIDSPCIDGGDPAIMDTVLDCSWGLGSIISDMGSFGGGAIGQVGIGDQEILLSDRFSLEQNYPNPFNNLTSIRYYVSKRARINLEIYNILGQQIAVLIEESKEPGEYICLWEAKNKPSGVYFARLQMANRSVSIKMILLK